MQLLSQHDPRWKNQILGYNLPNSIYTIGGYGCLITCLAMIAGADPGTLNNQLKHIGGYMSGGGFYIWGKINELYNVNESKVQWTTDPSRVKTEIKAGKICMLEVNYKPTSTFWSMHFVIAHKIVANRIMIVDPIDGKEKFLDHSYFGFRSYTTYSNHLTLQAQKDIIDNDMYEKLKQQVRKYFTDTVASHKLTQAEIERYAVIGRPMGLVDANDVTTALGEFHTRLQWALDLRVREEVAKTVIDPIIPVPEVIVSVPESNNLHVEEVFSSTKLWMGRLKSYLRCHLDKAALITAVIPFILFLNNQYNLGLDESTITSAVLTFAGFLVGIGVIKETK